MINSNPERIEFLIDATESHLRKIHSYLSELEGLAKNIKTENEKVLDDIQTAQPVNPKAIRPHIDELNETSVALLNAMNDVHHYQELAEDYESAIKQLRSYFNDQYMQTVNSN